MAAQFLISLIFILYYYGKNDIKSAKSCFIFIYISPFGFILIPTSLVVLVFGGFILLLIIIIPDHAERYEKKKEKKKRSQLEIKLAINKKIEEYKNKSNEN